MTSHNEQSEQWIVEAVKRFSEWDKQFYLWKSFSPDQRSLLKAYIGLTLFGNPSDVDEFELENIWLRFDKSERELISQLGDKFKFENNQVVIRHTYLYLNNDQISCVFCQMKSNNQVIFIDHKIRVYQSWDDFRDNNQLPCCQFVAPEDGLHKIFRQKLLIYKSPASSSSASIVRKTDVAAMACTLASAGLVIAATAPVSAMILGYVSVVYSVGRCINSLVDRSSHGQSIGLDNAESIFSWINIAGPMVGMASTAAISNSRVIVERAGKSASIAIAALKGLNYAALAVTYTNFGTTVYCLVEKLRHGEELTMFDCLEACVNLFLVFGATSDARKMNKFIKSLDAPPTTNTQGLTRTAKRKLQRLRAKLRASGNCVDVSGKADVKKVTIFEENIPALGMQLLYNCGHQFISRHFFDLQRIYYMCLEIWHTCNDFRFQKICTAVFVGNMINNVQNLYILITDALVSIKTKVEPLLKSYFPGLFPDSLTEQIGHMVQNTTSVVMNVDEPLLDDENEQTAENEPKLKYEIIFEAAKNRIPQTTPSSEIICAFSEQLAILIEEITSELKDNYEEWVMKNIEVLGKDKANEMFSKLGMKTLNDFANLHFVSLMKSKLDDVKTNHIIANEEMIQKVWNFYERVLSKVMPRSTLAELGAIETCQWLRQSLTEVLNPLGKMFKSSKELYEINASFVGHVTAMNMVLDTLNSKSKRAYSSDNSSFFDLAVGTFDVDRISRELSLSISHEGRTEKKVSSQLTEGNVQSTVLFLCDKFFRQVNSKLIITNREEREKRVKDCYHYFMEKFSNFVRDTNKAQNSEILRCLKLSGTFCDQYRNVCETSKYESFASAVELFTQEKTIEELAEKYVADCKDVNNFYVKVCNEINEEDGMRMFSINEGGFVNLRAYKNHAAKLFDFNENQMELIKWEKGSVLLKCGCDRNVIFQNVDTKSMIVMEIDTSKKSCFEEM